MRVVAEQPRFDLFVLDLMMPQMSGVELAQHLHAVDLHAKVLYLTGHTDLLLCVKQFRLDPNEAFLEKPVTIAGLQEATQRLLFGHVQSRTVPDL